MNRNCYRKVGSEANYEMGRFYCGKQFMGKLSISQAVYRKMVHDIMFDRFISRCIAQYQHSNWGNIEADEINQNIKAFKNGGCIIAAYVFNGNNDERVVIATDADRSYTIIRFSDEH